MLNEMEPMALPPLICSDFLNYILRSHKAPTTLVVCCSRETFLDQLRSCLVGQTASFSTSQPVESSSLSHPFLIPTLHLIAKSQSINLAFVPTLPHLRAFLAAYLPLEDLESPSSTVTRPGSQTPLFAIWDMAHLHRSTADHSAQGLSRTLATAVETARIAGQKFVLAESKERNQSINDEVVDQEEGTLDDPWKEQVPLLSGSVRFGGEERAWAGRTIEVGRVVAKWCKFVKLDD